LDSESPTRPFPTRILRDTTRVPALATLMTFVVIAAGFAALPGPSNMYVVSQGLRAGRRAGLAAAVGCAIGAMIYVAATCVGLAALLASSITALTVLHYVGGAYLVFLGFRFLRDRSMATSFDQGTGAPRRESFLRRGVFVELTNPKVALFFLALFPQFIHAEQGATWSQILVLGVLFCLVGLASDSLYAFGSGTIRSRLAASPRLIAWSNRASGTMCLGLGAWSIWSGARVDTR
jgi:threonine/homoserine/homoserine lactone efflux protein